MRAAAFLALTVLLSTDADENTLVITEESVNASCDQKVTLNCSISQPVEVLQYSWTYGNVTLCEYKNNMENCNYTDNQELLLNIQQVNPSHSGKYVCMLLADSGHGTKDTHLHVLGCNGQTKTLGQPLNHACAPESKWIIFLVSFTAVLLLMSDPGI